MNYSLYYIQTFIIDVLWWCSGGGGGGGFSEKKSPL